MVVCSCFCRIRIAALVDGNKSLCLRSLRKGSFVRMSTGDAMYLKTMLLCLPTFADSFL